MMSREEDIEIFSVTNVLLQFWAFSEVQTYYFSGIYNCAFQFEMQSHVLK